MSISQSPASKPVPELTFTPFEANNHRNQVIYVDDSDRKFSYILRSPERFIPNQAQVLRSRRNSTGHATMMLVHSYLDRGYPL